MVYSKRRNSAGLMLFARSFFTLGPVLLLWACRDSSPPATPSGDTLGVPAEVAGQAGPTLKSIMQGLEEDMVDLAHGIWIADREAVRVAAQGVADHPRVTPGQMATIQAELGDEFPLFVQQDQGVHAAAVELTSAAQANDADLLPVFVRIQEGCVGCHSRFRERVSEALAR